MAAKKEKNSFILFADWLDELEMLSVEQRGEWITAIFRYTRDGVITEFDDIGLKIMFSQAKRCIDRNYEIYVEECRKKSENGKKGGAPAGNQNARKAENNQNNQNNQQLDNSTKNNQNKQEVEKTSKTSLYDNDTDTDNVPVNENVPDTDTGTDNDIPAAGASEPCPYSKIIEMYHEICKSYPQIRSLSETRKKAVKARWAEFKSLDTFKEVFTKSEASSFMKGKNNRNWRADFDFMMKPSKIGCILEGKYDDRDKPEQDDGIDHSMDFMFGDAPIPEQYQYKGDKK